MAKRPAFTPKKTPKGWRVNVPAALTKSGKREQHHFKTRDEANEFALPLRETYRAVGEQRRALSPIESDDAAHALALLKEYGATLSDAARFYIAHHDKRAKAPTVEKAWDAALTFKKGLSARYLSDLGQWKRRLPSEFKAMNLADVQPSHISTVLDKITSGKTAWKNGLRFISAVFGDQVKKGAIEKNPCAGVVIPKVRKKGEVKCYTVKQLKALFAACTQYPDQIDRDCRPCAVPFAFLAFAGLRPAELERLRWENVNVELKNIRLGADITKSNQTRNVPINPTLMAWIETVPEKQRAGKIVPTRWTKKAARVKKEAGLDALELQDALRHSYGSYSLAMDHDMAALNASMGHAHMNVFFAHYHNAYTKKEAAPYWKVVPSQHGAMTVQAAAEK
jgi:integrase